MRGLITPTRFPVIRSAVIGERQAPYGAMWGGSVTGSVSYNCPHPQPPLPSSRERGLFSRRGSSSLLPAPRGRVPAKRVALGVRGQHHGNAGPLRNNVIHLITLSPITLHRPYCRYRIFRERDRGRTMLTTLVGM